MSAGACGMARPETIVRSLAGDDTVLCVTARRTTLRTVIVVNEHYPDALAHAERHIADGFTGIQVCNPDCPG